MKHIWLKIISLCFVASVAFCQPIVTYVAPNSGPVAGGTSVVVSGSGFNGVTGVTFGASSGTILSVSDTTLRVRSPSGGVPGTVHITVTAGTHSSVNTAADRFTYTGIWHAYVTGKDGTKGAMASINLSNESVEETLEGDDAIPFLGVAILPNGHEAYVADGGYIQVFDFMNNSKTAIECPPTVDAYKVAVTPDSLSAYSSFYDASLLGKIDTATHLYVPPGYMTGDGPEGVAITPDGQKIYVCNYTAGNITVIDNGLIDTISLSGSNPHPIGIVISPDGSTAFVTDSFSNVGCIHAIDVASDLELVNPFLVASNLYDIAMSPDGQYLYLTTNVSTVFRVKTDFSANALISPGLNYTQGIAISPDGSNAYVVGVDLNSSAIKVAIIDLTTSPPTVLPQTIDLTSFTEGHYIAISPDPSPAAECVASVGCVGSITSFDASRSVSPVGTIAQYVWNFGDGSPEIITTTPHASHTYLSPGNYGPSVTVINSAHTSKRQVFTGQTVSNNGSIDNAVYVVPIVVPPPIPPEPISFVGKLHKHHRHFYLNSWYAAPSPYAIESQVLEKRTVVQTSTGVIFSKKLHPQKYYRKHLGHYKRYLDRRYSVVSRNELGQKGGATSLKVQ
jgi:DNA-binding beta-propeller fold protein YncE